MRKTKIICTLGPACDDEAVIRRMMLAGMNVARFNMSHGTIEDHRKRCGMIKNLRDELGLQVAMLLDTRGPEIRLMDINGGRTLLESGETFILTTEDVPGDNTKAAVTYKNIINDVNVGMEILIDDGLIELKAEAVTDTDIICRVINGGVISDHKGVNSPGAEISMDYLNETDRTDILFGIEEEFDYIAASFVRNAADVLQVREILDSHGCNIKIISKIESIQGINNLDGIIDVSDGIMVARGDMGVEIPFEEVPILQKEMIKKAVSTGKIVITATQMLESMINNPRPTRAEAADVANAVYDGTTAIMLSGESAAGKYPVQAVETMSRIAVSTENDIDYKKRLKRFDMCGSRDITTVIAYATCETAMELGASAIITVTMTGFTAAAVSMFRPGCQIIGCTTSDSVARQLNLMWGVTSICLKPKKSMEELFHDAVAAALKCNRIKEGNIVVITAGVPLGQSGKTNMIRVAKA